MITLQEALTSWKIRTPSYQDLIDKVDLSSSTDISEYEASALNSLMSNLKIPERYKGMMLSDFKVDNSMQEFTLNAAKAYVDNFKENLKQGNGLIFLGSLGTGKTLLACAILQELCHKKCAGLYTTTLTLIRMIRSTWDKDATETETKVMNMLCSLPILVIDEIEVRYNKEAEMTNIFEILDRRYANKKSTIIITNQSVKGLQGTLGDKSFDRVVGTSKFLVFDWGSARRIKS